MTQSNEDAEESNDIQLKTVSSEDEHARLCEFLEIHQNIGKLETPWTNPDIEAPIERTDGDFLYTEENGVISSGALLQYEGSNLNSDEARILLFAVHLVYSSSESTDGILEEVGAAARSEGNARMTAVSPNDEDAKEFWRRNGFSSHQTGSDAVVMITGV